MFSEEVVPISHLGYIVCKEMLLHRLTIYLETVIKTNPKEAFKCISIIEKISSTKEPNILIQFQPLVELILNFLQTIDRHDTLSKLLKIIHNLTKNSIILTELESHDLIPIMLNLIVILRKKTLKDELFDLYYYTLKIISTLSEDSSRLEKLKTHGWRQVLEGVQIKEIVKKDIQDIYHALLAKSK